MNQIILEYLQTIPKGKVTTYKNIADRFNVHPRKVASVMKYNKHPDIYPCYKVVSADRKISGYSAYDGVSTKIKKLRSDGVVIINGKVSEDCVV